MSPRSLFRHLALAAMVALLAACASGGSQTTTYGNVEVGASVNR
ncbi:hypothetical protein [Microvirgula aerodenitrificans]|nr:hypothetical protein [Microvirgula aerodenitrificans]